MIKAGDRIFCTCSYIKEPVSGIVSHAIRCGAAMYVVAIWDGSSLGGNAYMLLGVSEFDVKRIERGCKFPSMPQPIIVRLNKAATLAQADFDKMHGPAHDSMCDLIKSGPSFIKLMDEMSKCADDLIVKLGTSANDPILSETLEEMMISQIVEMKKDNEIWEEFRDAWLEVAVSAFKKIIADKST